MSEIQQLIRGINSLGARPRVTGTLPKSLTAIGRLMEQTMKETEKALLQRTKNVCTKLMEETKLTCPNHVVNIKPHPGVSQNSGKSLVLLTVAKRGKGFFSTLCNRLANSPERALVVDNLTGEVTSKVSFDQFGIPQAFIPVFDKNTIAAHVNDMISVGTK